MGSHQGHGMAWLGCTWDILHWVTIAPGSHLGALFAFTVIDQYLSFATLDEMSLEQQQGNE